MSQLQIDVSAVAHTQSPSRNLSWPSQEAQSARQLLAAVDELTADELSESCQSYSESGGLGPTRLSQTAIC